MVAVEISGIECSKKVLQEVTEKMEKAQAEHQTFQPCVAFVQVGNLVDASVYIRNAQKKAKEVGVDVKVVNLPKTTIQKELETMIDELNNDDNIDGIILLLPLDCTNHIDADEVTDRILLSKDVDGMNSGNIGRLASGQLDKITLSCSAFGCLRLVQYATGDPNYISGKNVVILGRSKIGGCPLSSLFLWSNGTVTVCHSETPHIKDHCQKADILVAAIGQKHFVKDDWIKPGAFVIDAGFNVEEAEEPNGKSQFFGDVDTEAAKEIAGHITPVPGGVGPMTVAMLIWNTVELAVKRKLSQNK